MGTILEEGKDRWQSDNMVKKRVLGGKDKKELRLNDVINSLGQEQRRGPAEKGPTGSLQSNPHKTEQHLQLLHLALLCLLSMHAIMN